LADPSRSITTFHVACTPPSAGSIFCSVHRARTNEPLGNGDGNRTLFNP
jgi:hypothetical protein